MAGFVQALKRSDRSDAVVADDCSLSVGRILELADRLGTGLSVDGPLLVWSGRAADVVVALAAGDLSGRGVFVAHAAAPSEQVQSIASEYGMAGIVSDGLQVHEGSGSPDPLPGRIVVMTSGTTGTPKMARHTFDTLAGTIKATPSSGFARWILTYPPTAFAGLQVILSALVGGGVVVAPSDRSFEGFAHGAVTHGVTHISGTPTFWRGFLMALGDRALPLQRATLGGETADAAIIERIKERFPGVRLSHIYASTELGVIFSVGDELAGFPAHWVGDPDFEPELRVVDDVLEVRSSRRMEGYVSAHHAPIDSEGWFRTADLVKLKGNRFFFEGREDRVINVGGYKVRPEEVESVLQGLPRVAEARVYGRRAPITGEIVVADVVLAQDVKDRDAQPAQIVAELQGKLEAYKIPRLVQITDTIDVTEAGKKAR